MTLSDIKRIPSLDVNILALSPDTQSLMSFIQYSWGDPLPAALDSDSETGRVFDTVICSDVLYDERALAPLMETLRTLRFRTLVLGYKRRHDEPERAFLLSLAEWCLIQEVILDFPIRHLAPTQTQGQHILVATPRLPVSSSLNAAPDLL